MAGEIPAGGLRIDAEIKPEMVVEFVVAGTRQSLESSSREIAHRDQDLTPASPPWQFTPLKGALQWLDVADSSIHPGGASSSL